MTIQLRAPKLRKQLVLMLVNPCRDEKTGRTGRQTPHPNRSSRQQWRRGCPAPLWRPLFSGRCRSISPSTEGNPPSVNTSILCSTLSSKIRNSSFPRSGTSRPDRSFTVTGSTTKLAFTVIFARASLRRALSGGARFLRGRGRFLRCTRRKPKPQSRGRKEQNTGHACDFS